MESLAVKNAGIILLNNYIPLLFERLNLTVNNQFTSKENQVAAVHYLQYLITGISDAEDQLLTLNKVLCGLAPDESTNIALDISEAQRLLIEGLLNAAIGYWPAIGQTSINGFRGNWLVRDGLLRETEERWELTVDKRAYDILIHKSPFTFSIIKYQWMEKPIHVNWPY